MLSPGKKNPCHFFFFVQPLHTQRKSTVCWLLLPHFDAIIANNVCILSYYFAILFFYSLVFPWDYLVFPFKKHFHSNKAHPRGKRKKMGKKKTHTKCNQENRIIIYLRLHFAHFYGSKLSFHLSLSVVFVLCVLVGRFWMVFARHFDRPETRYG